MHMHDSVTFTLFFFSLHSSSSHCFLPCLSRLSDKRCLLAINPGGVLKGVPIKCSIFCFVGLSGAQRKWDNIGKRRRKSRRWQKRRRNFVSGVYAHKHRNKQTHSKTNSIHMEGWKTLSSTQTYSKSVIHVLSGQYAQTAKQLVRMLACKLWITLSLFFTQINKATIETKTWSNMQRKH